MKIYRSFLISVFCILLLSSSAMAKLPNKKVAVDFTNQSIWNSIDILCNTISWTWKADESLKKSVQKNVTIQVENVRWNRILLEMLRTTDLKYRVEGESTLVIYK